MARIVQLIYTEQYTGNGTEDDPCRNLPQLWTKDGQLIAESDPWKDGGKSFFNPVQNI